MKKKSFTKEQVAHKLGVQAYMISAWDDQFKIHPTMYNGTAHYTKKQLALLRTIKELVYEKGYSLDAAKQYLATHESLDQAPIIAATTVPLADQLLGPEPTKSAPDKKSTQQITTELRSLKEQLLRLKQSLS